jgi:ribonuclease HI
MHKFITIERRPPTPSATHQGINTQQHTPTLPIAIPSTGGANAPRFPSESQNLLVFTDGACVRNGKPGAKGSYAVVWPKHMHLNFARLLPPNEKQTNNRAELRAVLAAIEQANAVVDPSMSKTLIVHTDSMLIVNTVTKWMAAWKRNNWRKAGKDGAPVMNVDLLKTLDQRLGQRNIVFRFVRAHTNRRDFDSVHNHIVDQLATGVLHGVAR